MAVLVFSLAVGLAGCGGSQTKNSDLKMWTEPEPKNLEVLGAVPAFTFTSQDGQQVRLQDLKGKVVLFNFIYTNCKTECPRDSEKISKVRDELETKGLLGEKAMLVSISVDPARDTPEVLKKYGQKYGADAANWLWLTGTPEETKKVVREGFFIHYEKRTPKAEAAQDAEHDHGDHSSHQPAAPVGYDMDHMSVVALVDGQGQIRKIYTNTLSVTIKELVKDINKLLQG